jgi:hypothetical protein
MSDLVNHLPWEEEDWDAAVNEWLFTILNDRGIRMTSAPVQIHLQPWSTVLRVPTDQGNYYLKALCPVLKYEPVLTQQLAIWHPNCIQPVLAVDAARGWMLLPEGGQTLRKKLETNFDLNYWKKIFLQYTALQISMIQRVPALLSLGVSDRRLTLLPTLYTRLLEDIAALLIDQTGGLTSIEYERLVGLTPTFKQMCRELGTLGIPETLQHDDFHDGNIFVEDNGFRFFDWAESFIAHPFFTLVVGLRSIASRFQLDEGAKEIEWLKEAYLEQWQPYAHREELLEALRLAMIIGRVNRALTWYMVVSSLPESYRAKEADAVPGWLQLFLETIKSRD